MKRPRERKEIPREVAEAFSGLKEKLRLPLSLKRIGGHYYLYKQVIEWDKERKKYICKESGYLGRITDEGKFRAKAIRGARDIESAKAVIAAYGGKVILPDEKQETRRAISRTRLTDEEKEIITSLTMDSKARLGETAKRIGMSGRKLGYKIASLERRLALQYVPYINIRKLGYSSSIVFVKFLEHRPDPERLKEELGELPNVQFGALTTNGKYDMMLFVAAETSEDFASVLGKIQEIKSLWGIKAEWYISYFFATTGFTPIRSNFFKLLEGRVRTRGASTHESPWSLSRNEYSTLLAMSRNGNAQFSDIERDSKMSTGSARYAYEKLRSREIIGRMSVGMRSLGVLYNAAIVLDIIDIAEFSRTRVELLKFINDEEKGFITNRFCLAGDIGLPDGGLLIMPVMKEGDLERAQSELARKVKGIRVSSFIITDTLCGRLVYRRFDNKESSQSKAIVGSYGSV